MRPRALLAPAALAVTVLASAHEASASLCMTSADCDGGACVGGACEVTYTCLDAHHLVGSNGTTVDCSPYSCSNGLCEVACASTTECAPPTQCTASHECVAPDNAYHASGCGSSVAGRSAGTGGAPFALLAVAGAALRARRRASRTSQR